MNKQNSKPMTQRLRKKAGLGVFWILAVSNCQCALADSPYTAGDQNQWDRFTYQEQTGFSGKRGLDPVPTRVRRQQIEAEAARAKSKADSQASVSIGSFQVPTWITTTSTPTFQRPIEIINNSVRHDSSIPSSFVGAPITTPFIGSWAVPYSWSNRSYGSWLPGTAAAGWSGHLPGNYTPSSYSWGLPSFGGVAAARAIAPVGVPGYGYGGWGGLGYGGWGYGGSGWGYGGWGGYGWGGWSPAAAALGFRRGPICDPGGTRVFQSGPSKASGNYYQPSTADPTASGGYYASSGNQQVIAPSPEPIKDYWGPEGNPFKQQMNAP